MNDNGDWSPVCARIEQSGRAWTEREERLFSSYLRLLLAARSRFNLVGSDNPDVLVPDHIADSLIILPDLDQSGARRLADVGSGAGFPGVPLALAMPETRFVLMESRSRRAEFLQQVCAALLLENVEVVSERAETLGRDAAHRETYDAVVSRATAPLARLVELCLPLVRQGGRLVAHKGRDVAGEVEAAHEAVRILGGGAASVRETDSARGTTVVTVEKIAATPEKYPRKAAQIEKRPL